MLSDPEMLVLISTVTKQVIVKHQEEFTGKNNTNQILSQLLIKHSWCAEYWSQQVQ